MMSKRSFLAKTGWMSELLENARNRMWVFILTLVGMLLCLPLGLTMTLSNMSSMKPGPSTDELLQCVKTLLGPNAVIQILISLLAVIIAMQGFAYLSSRRQMDLYESLPVSRNQRFWMVYANGVFFYLIAAIVSLLLSLLIAAMNHALDTSVVSFAVNGFVLNLLAFLASYHLSILGIVLTGRIMSNVMAILVLYGYELIVRFLFAMLAEEYFETFTYLNVNEIQRPKLSAIYWLFDATQTAVESNNQASCVDVCSWNIFCVFVIIIGLLVLSWFLYQKRQTESAEKTIAFSKLMPVLKVAFIVPGGLLVSQIFRYSTTNSIAFEIFGLVLGVVFTGGIVQILFDMNVKSFFKKPISFAIGTVLTAFIFFSYNVDLFGMEDFIPDDDKVLSCAISIAPFQDKSYIDMYGQMEWGSFYQLQQMELTGEDISIAAELMKQRKHLSAGEDFSYEYIKEQNLNEVNLKWHMKNGDEQFRVIYLNLEENKALIDRLLGSESYQQTVYQLTNPEAFAGRRELTISYSDGLYQTKLDSSELATLSQAYREDMKQYNLDMAQSIPCGMYVVEQTTFDNGQKNTAWEAFPIYPSFSHTASFLGKEGVSSLMMPYGQPGILSATVCKENNEVSVGTVYEEEISCGDDERKTVNIDDPELLTAIAGSINTVKFLNGSCYLSQIDPEYSVNLDLAEDPIVINNVVYQPIKDQGWFGFIKGQVPAEVEELMNKN